MTVRARFEIVAEDLVDGLDVVEQPPDQDLFVRGQCGSKFSAMTAFRPLVAQRL